MEPERLELYPYHTFMEPSEEKDAVAEQDVASNDTNTEVKGQRGLLSLTSLAPLSENWTPHYVSQRRISLLSGWLPYPPAPPCLPSLPPLADLSLHPLEGVREVGRIFVLPGATGSLCHPLTQTAGSALHTRIIRR